jgi:hypothetical protein
MREPCEVAEVDRRAPRLLKLLSHPRGWLLPVALAFLLPLPALSVGRVLDDWVLLARLRGLAPFPRMERPLFEAFALVPASGPYAERVRGFLAWWAAPELEITFFRPLAVVTHVLDEWAWPASLPLQHLHSLAWYALAVAAVAWCFRVASTHTATAGLAAILFAVEDAHGMPAAWISNRNALIALCFGALAVGAHARWRQGGGRRFAFVSPLCLLLGLLAGESAIGALAYVVAWECCRSEGSLVRRALAVLPSLLCVGAWRLLYEPLGFRAHGSGLYLDPLGQAFAFARGGLERAPVLLLSQWTQLQGDLYLAFPRPLQLAMTAAGAACLLLLARLFWRMLASDAEARFWALGMIFALVPPCATFPMDRLLTFVGIGAFGLLSVQVQRLGWIGVPPAEAASRMRRGATLALLGLHLVLGPPLLALRSLSPRLLYGAAEDAAGLVPAAAPVEGETWIVVNGFDLFAMYLPIIRGAKGWTVPGGLEILASITSGLEMERVDDRTLVVRPDDGFLFGDLDRLVRAREFPFESGQRISRPGMEVEILEVLPDGRPVRAAFHFARPLEDASYRWFQAHGASGGIFTPPPVGGTTRLESLMAGLSGF